MTTPELGPIGDIRQIGLNDEQVSACDDSPRDDRPDVELAAHLQRIDILSFVSERQAARADAETWELGEVVDERFADSVGQVIGVWVAACVEKGQHCHRLDLLGPAA